MCPISPTPPRRTRDPSLTGACPRPRTSYRRGVERCDGTTHEVGDLQVRWFYLGDCRMSDLSDRTCRRRRALLVADDVRLRLDDRLKAKLDDAVYTVVYTAPRRLK